MERRRQGGRDETVRNCKLKTTGRGLMAGQRSASGGLFLGGTLVKWLAFMGVRSYCRTPMPFSESGL